ncbi:hypothetical protein [Paenibacillus sp. NPDC058174]|uniref:hypothetical protein n=1 Tax=Paenibacillus sp. NPDC058174 TaxID=3346366 RepID=UPI0036DD365E
MYDLSYSIWLEAEAWLEETWDIHDVNMDVIVEFEDGSRWIATFYTYKNILTLAEKDKQTGEHLNGKYFWGSDMVLVDECSRSRIEEVIEHLLNKGDFVTIFDKCDDHLLD